MSIHNNIKLIIMTAYMSGSLSSQHHLHADTQEHAMIAARAVKVTYESLGPPILSIQDAIDKNSFFKPDIDPLKVGDAEGTVN